MQTYDIFRLEFQILHTFNNNLNLFIIYSLIIIYFIRTNDNNSVLTRIKYTFKI